MCIYVSHIYIYIYIYIYVSKGCCVGPWSQHSSDLALFSLTLEPLEDMTGLVLMMCARRAGLLHFCQAGSWGELLLCLFMVLVGLAKGRATCCVVHLTQ